MTSISSEDFNLHHLPVYLPINLCTLQFKPARPSCNSPEPKANTGGSLLGAAYRRGVFLQGRICLDVEGKEA